MTQMAQLARNRAHFYGIQRIDLGQEAAEALLRACYRVGAHEHALEVSSYGRRRHAASIAAPKPSMSNPFYKPVDGHWGIVTLS